MIRKFLTYRKAIKIQDKFNKILPFGVDCVLIRKNKESYKEIELKIQNRFGATKQLSRRDNDIKELIGIIFDACKRFHMSFIFHSHGLDYVYISVEVK